MVFVTFYIPKWAQITNLTKNDQINNNFDHSPLVLSHSGDNLHLFGPILGYNSSIIISVKIEIEGQLYIPFLDHITLL